jgi:flagellar hook-length control protein FliK
MAGECRRFFGDVMSNTNLGVLLPSRPSQVDRPQFSEKSSDVSNNDRHDKVKADAKDGTKDSFKDRMSSVESRHDEYAEKTSKKSIQDRKESDSINEKTTVKTGTIEKNDSEKDSSLEQVKNSTHVENHNSESSPIEIGRYLTINDQGALSLTNGEGLSFNNAFGLQQPVSLSEQQGILLSSAENALMPDMPELISEIGQAVQKAIALEGIVSKSVNPLTVSTSGALPATEFFNKLSMNGTVNGNSLHPNTLSSSLLNSNVLNDASISITDASESADFDIAAALNKDLDKPALSPLVVATPQAIKMSPEALLPSQLSLNASFKSAGQWSEAVTEKVMWMSSKGIKEAIIQLDPPELGSLQIKVGLTQDQAQVSFTVQNPSVREALDQQSMRLREMFAEDGLNLTDVDVSDQSSQEESGEEKNNRSFGQHSHAETDEIMTTSLQSNNGSYSLIDAYI